MSKHLVGQTLQYQIAKADLTTIQFQNGDFTSTCNFTSTCKQDPKLKVDIGWGGEAY